MVDAVTNGLDFDALVGVWASAEVAADNGAALKIGTDVAGELAHAGH